MPSQRSIHRSPIHPKDINVYGLITMVQAFAPVLKANDGGVFAQMNSVVSMKCFYSFATYSASKAAAYSMTQALREMLEGQGTWVLSVHPGPIATDMGDAAGLTEIAESPTLVPEGIIEALKAGEFHVFSRHHGQADWRCLSKLCPEYC
jgi:short-subunit dehydrogenase